MHEHSFIEAILRNVEDRDMLEVRISFSVAEDLNNSRTFVV